jgi:hypothetical protein
MTSLYLKGFLVYSTGLSTGLLTVDVEKLVEVSFGSW